MASVFEAIYLPTSMGPYEDGDTTPFTVPGRGGEDPGFAGFTKELKNLGPIVHTSPTSDADVDRRIRSAAVAFGAPRSSLCNFALEETLRSKVYSVLVLAVLLYGNEV